MCARFSVAGEKLILDLFGLDEKPVITYNAAPTDPVTIVRPQNGHLKVEVASWGLRPFWTKQPLINAKVESVLERSAFKPLFTEHRCLVPVTGFYEWEKLPDGKKQPYMFVMDDRSPFALAGFWSETKEGKELCVLTTEPNELLKCIHDRMPAIVRKEDFEAYMRSEPREAQAIAAASYPAEEMTSFRVSTKMSSSKYKEPDCVEAI